MTSLVSTPSYTDLEVFSPIEHSPTVSTPDTLVTTSEAEHRSRRDSRHKIKAHLFGTGSESGRKESSDEESESRNGNGLVDAARGVRDRLSRTSTMGSHLPNARRSRSQLSRSQSRRSPQLEKVQQELEDSDHMANEIRERAFHDNLAALNHMPLPVNEEMHVDSVCSPIRRRSLLTPGIATRTPNDILRKPPQLQQCQEKEINDYYFNPMLPDSSPLSKLAALDLANQGRSSPVPRSSTPSDLDYTHLGRLKLGTLRITNGSESPLPGTYSPLNRKSSLEACCQDDNSVPVQRNYCEDHGIIPAISKKRSGDGYSIDPTKILKSIDGGKNEISRPSRLSVDMSAKEQRDVTPRKFERPKNNPSSSDESLKKTYMKPKNQKKRSKSLSVPCSRLHDHAAGIAESYISELPSSPFFLNEDPPTARPETKVIPHKTIAPEENPIEDEYSFVLPSPAGHKKWSAFLDDAESRHSVGESSGRDILLEGSSAPNSIADIESRSVSPSVTSDADHPSGPDTMRSITSVNKTADSGYGSSTSLQSLTASTMTVDRAGSRLRPVLKSIGLKARRLSGPRDMPGKIMINGNVQQKENNIPGAKTLPMRPALKADSQPHSLSLKSDSSLQSSSETVITIGSSCSSTSQSSFDVLTFKSLMRSSQPLPITVQSSQDLDSSKIPPVPSGIATKHAKRLQRFPLLEHTFPSLDNTDSGDGILTPELLFVPVTFPSPAHAPDVEYPPSNVNFDYPAENAENKIPDHLVSRRKSIFASISQRRSSRQAEPSEYDLTTIADFGTVTESLGGSPYDIARSRQSEKPHLPKNASLSHPHQMSTAVPRVKCMAGMDDCRAAELTRLRSQNRSRSLSRPRISSRDSFDGIFESQPRPRSLIMDIPAIPALPRLISQKFPLDCNGVAQKKPRPRSMIVEASPKLGLLTSTPRKPFNDRGGIPGKMPRPRSMFVNTPPVPALPTVEQVEQKEAEMQKLRSVRPHIPTPPHNSHESMEPSKPDKVNEKAVGTPEPLRPDQAHNWDTYREAWSQRRRSAGNRLSEKAQTMKAPESPVLMDRQTTSKPLTPRPEINGRPQLNATQYLSVPKQASRSFHIPLTPPPSLPQSHNSSTTSLECSSAPAGRVERLAGRFDGGLSFGYEPGYGLGGSAGTRNMRTGASRKSVDVSLGYGIDLSDIPIFVAPS